MNLKQVVVNGQKLNVGGGSGGNSESLDIYSTEETRIGTWIDGKPLYRKYFEISPQFINGTTSTAPSSALVPCEKNPAIDSILTVRGIFYRGSETYSSQYEFNVNYGSNYGFILRTVNYIEESKEMVFSIKGYQSGPINDCIKSFAILEYTKTTDQPEVTS